MSVEEIRTNRTVHRNLWNCFLEKGKSRKDHGKVKDCIKHVRVELCFVSTLPHKDSGKLVNLDKCIFQSYRREMLPYHMTQFRNPLRVVM